MRFVVLDASSTVQNVILLDASAEYDPGDGMTLLAVPDDSTASIGASLIAGSAPPAFNAPPVIATPEVSALQAQLAALGIDWDTLKAAMTG